MNLSGLPDLLLAWLKSQGAGQLQSDRQGQPSPFRPGAQYDAKVLDNLPGGRHLVQVAGQKMDMSLPGSARPGDTLKLTYLNGGPRPTFLLNQATAPPAPASTPSVSLSSTAQQVNALMRIANPTSTPAQAPARAGPPTPAAAQNSAGVNGTGGGVPGADLATRAGATRPAGQALGSGTLASPGELIKSGSPAAASPGRPAGNLEGMARPVQAVASGSSTAMVAGARPIAANVVMLQSYSATMPLSPGSAASPNTALVGQAVDGLRAAVPSSTTLTPNVLAGSPAPTHNLLPARLFQTLSESGLFYESHLARWVKGDMPFESILREPQAQIGREMQANARLPELGGMPDEAARLAGRQLHLLDGAPFLWQGMAWPGQWMEWLVEERPDGSGEGDGGEEGTSRWVTEIRLDLPAMGAVHAHIGINGERVGLRLIARDESVRSAMQAALSDLAKGLEASGLKPVSLIVDLPDEA